MSLDESLARDLQSKPWQAFLKQNPGIGPLVEAYLDGGPRPDISQLEPNHYAVARVLAEDARRGDPEPIDLPFQEAELSNPLTPTISPTTTTFACESGRDYLIDLGMVPRRTLILTGSPRRVQIRNAHFRISDPMTTGPYWRGGLALQLPAEHVSITNYFVEAGFSGCTLADGLRIACGRSTKVTVQRFRIEAREDTNESAEHCDALQIQGPIGALELGLGTAYAAGVRPPNHGGKCFQIAHEPWPGSTYGGPFSVSFDRVNMVGLGAGQGRFGTMFIRGPESHHVSNVYVGQITETLKDVWAVAAGTGATDFPGWFAVYASSPGTVTGSAPNRRITFSPTAHKIAGYVQEGRPPGGDFVTRASLGV